MRAVFHIIATQGIAAVSIEEVARCSGVAKTTIYRRYSNTEDLIAHLPHMVHPTLDFDDLTPSHDSLCAVFERMMNYCNDEFELTAIGIVLSSNNETLSAVAQQVIAPIMQRFQDFITRGQQSGIFHAHIDADFIFQSALGSMLACKALQNREEASWCERMTALIWPSVRA